MRNVADALWTATDKLTHSQPMTKSMNWSLILKNMVGKIYNAKVHATTDADSPTTIVLAGDTPRGCSEYESKHPHVQHPSASIRFDGTCVSAHEGRSTSSHVCSHSTTDTAHCHEQQPSSAVTLVGSALQLVGLESSSHEPGQHCANDQLY